MQKNASFINKCSSILLAAGKSQRMGEPKFSLAFDDKQSFLEKIVKDYRSFGCKEIVVVVNPEGFEVLNKKNKELIKQIKIVVNDKKDSPRFYSLQLGLKKLKSREAVFIHNVDNPFVNALVLENMLSLAADADYITPKYKGRGGHPILLSDKVCQNIISEKEPSVILSEFLKNFTKRSIEAPDNRILVNINTKDLYKKYFG